jgi:hypothetical protein
LTLSEADALWISWLVEEYNCCHVEADRMTRALIKRWPEWPWVEWAGREVDL